ncbi:MAG: hypothetical protein MUF18_00885 [Fimbriiglobus sp.]|nr:hypothetical protein [Fimbriiglobus sp.]
MRFALVRPLGEVLGKAAIAPDGTTVVAHETKTPNPGLRRPHEQVTKVDRQEGGK